MGVMKFEANRVRRNYVGGREIDRLQQVEPAVDSNRPEEWLASLVPAMNEGLAPVENEGLSVTESGALFRDVVRKEGERLLGSAHYERYGESLGFLVKLLDSSMRLHTQAHPTREFAQAELDSDWGKLECYYVLSVRDGQEGYIRLGFQNAPSKAEWKEIVKTQDMARMDACFEKVPIQAGDIVYIPGGVPHAIGEGILLVEIMEPSDLVVRCEFEREGVRLPEEGRFMGKGLDFCLDVFDYTEYSVADVLSTFYLKREVVIEPADWTLARLIPAEIARTFEVFSLQFKKSVELALDERFLVGLNVGGEVDIWDGAKLMRVREGESFFVPADQQQIEFHSVSGRPAKLCLVGNVL